MPPYVTWHFIHHGPLQLFVRRLAGVSCASNEVWRHATYRCRLRVLEDQEAIVLATIPIAFIEFLDCNTPEPKFPPLI